jgi:hypothetical protein
MPGTEGERPEDRKADTGVEAGTPTTAIPVEEYLKDTSTHPKEKPMTHKESAQHTEVKDPRHPGFDPVLKNVDPAESKPEQPLPQVESEASEDLLCLTLPAALEVMEGT